MGGGREGRREQDEAHRAEARAVRAAHASLQVLQGGAPRARRFGGASGGLQQRDAGGWAGVRFGRRGGRAGRTGGGGRVPRGFGGQRHGVGAGHAARHEDVDSPPRRRHAQAVVRDSTREMIVPFEGTLY